MQTNVACRHTQCRSGAKRDVAEAARGTANGLLCDKFSVTGKSISNAMECHVAQGQAIEVNNTWACHTETMPQVSTAARWVHTTAAVAHTAYAAENVSNMKIVWLACLEVLDVGEAKMVMHIKCGRTDVEARLRIGHAVATHWHLVAGLGEGVVSVLWNARSKA